MQHCDVQTGTRNAVALHVLSLVLNKQTFRSSDSVNRKRSKYKKMFPDSSFTSLNCGKTKASYIAVHALAPYAREQFRNLYSGKLFGLHVDETTYNRKVQKDISSTNDELKKAKELVEHLEKKKSKLEADRDSVAVSFVNQL